MSTKSQFPVLLNVTISEGDSAYEIYADVSDFDAESVSVSAWEDTLIIDMQSRHENHPSHGSGALETTSHRRVVPLGFQLRQDRIESNYNNGTVIINVDKIVDESVMAQRTKRTSA